MEDLRSIADGLQLLAPSLGWDPLQLVHASCGGSAYILASRASSSRQNST